MIAALEAHILGRLARITLDGEPITVYGPGDDRTKGETVYPCGVLLYHILPYVDMPRTRPHIEVFTPSEEEQTILVPGMGGAPGTEVTGPASWSWKPCPTPMIVPVQIELQATEKAQADRFVWAMNAALPPPYEVVIQDAGVQILPEGPPIRLDEDDGSIPIFRFIQRYEASNVWVERPEEWTKPSIRDVQMEWDEM